MSIFAPDSYRPWRDPLCYAAWGAYCLNRFWLAPHFGVSHPFLREHFNDSLLIPAALPVLYWIRWVLKLRPTPAPPRARDVLLWCLGWSVSFEWFGPHFLHRSVGDWGDVAAYFAGGALAALWWQLAYHRSTRAIDARARETVS